MSPVLPPVMHYGTWVSSDSFRLFRVRSAMIARFKAQKSLILSYEACLL
ncbi:hypothetical protein J2067_004934, partial [Erwinia rhapontici]|nr:hypothetical protein [Erwinia rhapontici]